MNRPSKTQVSVIRHSSFVIARRALTLVEMLIGMAITLVMMAAVVNLFANISSSVNVRRATMEMSGQLRLVRATLFNDLAGATCRPLPWQRPDEDPGYIEIIEGGFSDKRPSNLNLDPSLSLVPSSQNISGNQLTDGMALGDYDDILALTVQSESTPFQGTLPIWNSSTEQWNPSTIKSDFAEVIWYAVENPADGSLGEPGMRKIYRRVFLIAPRLPVITPSKPFSILTLPPYTDQTMAYYESDGSSGTTTVPGIASDNEVYRYCDVSFHREGNLRIPNTLGDLAKRENRFAHQFNGPTLFPHEMDQRAIRVPTGNRFPTGFFSPLHPFGLPFEWDPADPDPMNPTIPPTPDRQGEDLMLDNVLAFDIRVFDPGAPLRQIPPPPAPVGTVLEPSDSGWATASTTAIGFGAYVDLGWGGFVLNDPSDDYIAPNGAPQPLFYLAHAPSWHPTNNTNEGYWAVYDAWSFHYEHDGLDQDNRDGDNDVYTGADEGTNGLDDDGYNGVDDVLERETSPPYPVPLRGMQVKLRIYEPDTRQIREANVIRSFVPQ